MPSLNDLFLPDGETLTSMIVGKPGSGKSFYLKNGIKAFLKSNNDPDFRLVYLCPKNEMVFDWLPKKQRNPIPVDKLETHLRYNRTAVVWLDPDFIESEADFAIDMLFAIKQSNPKFSATIVVDDAQTFIQSRRAASQSFRRLALTGRSKGIRFVAVSHQMVFSKDLEGSTSYIVFFSMPVKLYHRDAQTRYGFDPEPYIERMAEKDYSFVWFDVTKGNATLFDPIEV